MIERFVRTGVPCVPLLAAAVLLLVPFAPTQAAKTGGKPKPDALRACLQTTRDHLAAKAKRNLTAAETTRLRAIIESLKGGKQQAAMDDWEALMKSVVPHEKTGPVDVAAMILHVLREAYVEVNPDRSYLADRISTACETLVLLRQYQDKIRGLGKVFPVTVQEPVVGQPVPQAAWHGGPTTPTVTYRGRTIANQQDLEALLMEVAAQIAETDQSFNLQYGCLQQNMQDETRRFSLMSNIMETKHHTAKNSIGNLG